MSDMPPLFKGKFQFRLDQRGRLRIPVRWREALGGDRTVTLLKPFQLPGLTASCVAAWPEAMFNQHRLEAMATGSRAPESVAERAWLLSAPLMIHEPDASGRFKLTFAQLEGAGLAPCNEVILAGVLNRFEVWAPENWRRIADAEAASAAAVCDRII